MKKFLAILLTVAMLLSVASFAAADDGMKVAMITDYGDITDQSFNQTTYEACKAFCEGAGLDFQYYKPNSDSDTDRISSIEKAIDEGFNVIVMPGYAFGPAIQQVAPEFSDITFIALDVSEGDIGDLRCVPGRTVRLHGRLRSCEAGLQEAWLPGRHGGSRGCPLRLRFRAGR